MRIGRMILEAVRGMNEAERGWELLCSMMITPDPVIHTYGVGVSLMQMRSRTGQEGGRVELPASLVTPTA